MQFIRGYDILLQRHPILTKSVTSAFLFGLGDGIAQKIQNSKNENEEIVCKLYFNCSGCKHVLHSTALPKFCCLLEY